MIPNLDTMSDSTLAAEAEFLAAVKELRRKSSAARLAVLRYLATRETPIDISGPTEWLTRRKLIRSHPAGLNSRRYTITDLGRRALTALETA